MASGAIPQPRTGLSGVGAETVIATPQFLGDVDVRSGVRVPGGALYWDVDGWKSGQPSLGGVAISSFTAMDCLLSELVRTIWPPPLSRRDRVVAIVGNSAGGQFVNRYAVVGRWPDALAADGIGVRFVIASPSSYLYFTPERPVIVPGEPEASRVPGHVAVAASVTLPAAWMPLAGWVYGDPSRDHHDTDQAGAAGSLAARPTLVCGP